MKKLLLLILIGIFLISFISAAQQSLGVFKQGGGGDCIELIQTCGNCTYNNVSRVIKTGENPKVFIINTTMTRDDTYYNYSFCNITKIGIYKVNGFGDPDAEKTSWIYDFEITGTGFEFSQPRVSLSIALLGIIIFLFIITLIAIPMLPSKDNYDDEKTLISINQLKYIRPVLWVVAWFLIVAIVFTGSNIAFAYMGSTLLADILFRIFQIMFGLSLPMIVVWFCYIFYSIFKDKQMKKYLDRGWE